MKIKYLFIALVAVIGLFASCDDTKELDPLSGIQVSQSSLSIPQEGGEVSFDVTAAADWKFVTNNSKGVAVDSVPAWITSSHAGGSAGTTKVTFKADATKGANSSTFKIVSGSQTQYIQVIQGVLNPELSTCAQVIAGADGDTYRVQGTITKLSNTTYGNWYIKDETGEVYVYGTLDASGAEKNFASLGLDEGDQVMIQGPKKTYSGTVELVNVTVLSYKKSVLKIDSISDSNVLKEGGEFQVYINLKGDGLKVEIPEEDKDWLTMSGITTESNYATVTFKAAPNAGGARESTISFTSSKNTTVSTVTASISQEGSIKECTIAEFNAFEAGTAQYRITGIITKVANTKYGNCYIADATGETYVYGMGNVGDFQEMGLKVGDIVTISGVKDVHNGEGQMKNATIEAVKEVTPVTVAEFLAQEDNNDVYYLLTGKVGNIKNTTYGNYDLVDETGSVYIYGTLAGWGGAGGQFESLGIGEGSEIAIITIKTSYKDVAQGKNAMVFHARD